MRPFGWGRNRRQISARTITGTHSSLTSSRSRARRDAPVSPHAQEGSSDDCRKTAPLSSELRHCTACPSREATWAQPLSREELS